MTTPTTNVRRKLISEAKGLRRLAPLLVGNGSGTVLGHLTHILMIPVQLAYLGASQFGLLALFISVVMASAIADTGIGQTVLRFVARSSRFPKLVEHVLASGLTVIVMLALTLVGLGALINWLLGALFGVTSIAGIPSEPVLALTAAALGLGMLVALALNTLRGLRSYLTFSICDTTYRVTVPLVLGATAYLTGDVLLVFAAHCIVIAILAAVLLVLAARKAHVRLRLTTNFRYFRKRMLHFSKWVWLQALAGYLGGQSDRFIVAAFVSMSAAGYYAIAATISSGVVGIATAVSGFLLPEAASRLKQHDWLIRTFRRATFYLSAASAIAILAFTPLAMPIIGSWINSTDNLLIVPFLIPLLWSAASTVTSIPATQFMNAMGHQRLAARIGIVANVITAIAIGLGGWVFGTFGVVGARLLVLPIGLASRTIFIRQVFKSPTPLRDAFAITWPNLLGAIVGLLMLAWLLS